MMRSGTSIGANVQEGVSAESKKDFIHKLSVAVKEARETTYWLSLLKDANLISVNQFNKINQNCEELVRILNSIILTTKERYFQNIHNS